MIQLPHIIGPPLNSFKSPLTGLWSEAMSKADNWRLQHQRWYQRRKHQTDQIISAANENLNVVKRSGLVCGLCCVHLICLIRVINTGLSANELTAEGKRLSSWVNIWKSFDVLAFSSAVALWLTGFCAAPFLWLFSIRAVVEALELPLF